jgi:hypothetical protein
MLAVVDKKVVKHLANTGGALLEIPVRVSFQYNIDNGEFINSSMERKILYNQAAALRRLPRMDAQTLDEDIENTVDQMLIEHLRYAGHATDSITLYPRLDPPEEEDKPAPRIILPGDDL